MNYDSWKLQNDRDENPYGDPREVETGSARPYGGGDLNMVAKVHSVARHRNGISGEPFYAVLFEHDGRQMVGVVFDENIHQAVAVLDVGLLAAGDVEFGSNSWRGDSFAPQLMTAIEKWEKDQEAARLAGRPSPPPANR